MSLSSPDEPAVVEADTRPALRRIALLVTQYEPGGAQKAAQMQAAYLHQRGYDVTLCFLYDKQGGLAALRRRVPYRVLDMQAKQLEAGRLANAGHALRGLARLYRWLRAERVQAILTFTYVSNVMGILMAWLAGVPLRIAGKRDVLTRWYLPLETRVVNSRLVDRVTVVSAETQTFCVSEQRMRADKLVFIANGVAAARFDPRQWPPAARLALRQALGVDREARLLICVGRLDAVKGQATLLRALVQVAAAQPAVLLLLAGDGPERPRLTALAAELGVADRVRLLGARDDVPRLLALGELFVLPSLQEGMPNAVLEAMAAGLPVVGTAVGGVPELVVDGETGVLVPPGDATALADALLALLAAPARAAEMGRRGRQRAAQAFSQEAMCRQVEQLLTERYAAVGR